MQTIIVILIIAAAIAYVAWKYRPSRLKSENPCDSCSGCAAGQGGDFTTRPEVCEPGACCDNEQEPESCPYSGERKEVASNKDIP